MNVDHLTRSTHQAEVAKAYARGRADGIRAAMSGMLEPTLTGSTAIGSNVRFVYTSLPRAA